jgi:hypothetical protein
MKGSENGVKVLRRVDTEIDIGHKTHHELSNLEKI